MIFLIFTLICLYSNFIKPDSEFQAGLLAVAATELFFEILMLAAYLARH